jgi:hypothetical protein
MQFLPKRLPGGGTWRGGGGTWRAGGGGGQRGPRPDEQQVEVSRNFYLTVAEGDTVKVNLKPGLLLIPWYYLSYKKSDPVQ